ncbi:STP1 protein [Plasmodium malariae]|uniref:STP1 protein n=1 Tax=Plasmodium malariae TaxID=5858 RepID=A0A1D3SN67_PLAMA|nr:STP1 protein [Plasmodium malariae]SCO92859.1 STP1 protein [Plasmodium malariae]
MDSCFSSKLNVRGSGFFTYFYDLNFQKIIQNIKNKSANVNKSDKEAFRNVCRNLSKYLIENKSPPPYYSRFKDTWEGALKKWVQSHYEKIDIHKECPVILEENEMKILELKYDEEDFCEKRSTYLSEIRQLKPRTLKTCGEEYLKKCNEYNDWINKRNIYFRERVSLINGCYRKESVIGKKGKRQKSLCNILEEETFRTSLDCALIDQNPTCKNLQEKKKEDLQESQKTAENPSKTETSMVQAVQTLQGEETKSAPDPQVEENTSTEHQFQLQDKLETEISGLQNKIVQSEFMQPNQVTTSRTQTKANGDDESLKGRITLPNSHPEVPPKPQTPEKHALNAESSIPFTRSANFAKTPKISGLFKKKKKIKRRPVKFLRILNPLLSWKKSEFLAHDHLENLKYDSEKTIKNIIINEHNMNNKVHVSNRKKDRYKTIIEVHMKILEEYRNTKWEYKKGEFLEIFLELFTEEEYTTYPNITNDELIKEDTKSINDIEKQKILWNKWIEKHQNLADKLKKEHWFNNLKNDWKRELDNLKKREELKNDPDEIQNIPFSQREKDIWRQWISEKCIIIKQYIKQDLFNYLTDELQIIPDELDNEKIKDSLLLINIGELSNKEDCQELYKYIKKKLLTKLCILVLMSVLEECKKEQDIENNESHLDNNIIETKEKENSDSKKEFIENISEFNRYFLENTENNDYKTDDIFKKELENWIIEDNTNVNSMKKENTADKYY